MKLNFNDLTEKELFIILLSVLKNHKTESLFQGNNWFAEYENAIVIFNNETGDGVEINNDYTSYLSLEELINDTEDEEFSIEFNNHDNLDEIIRLTIGDYVDELVSAYQKYFMTKSECLLEEI